MSQNLKEHQDSLLSLLCQFDRICRERGITWWLDSGTLLGAARNGGFIPWDDDVDVCILAKDYRKIRRLLSDIPEPYSYQSSHKGQTRLSPRFVDTSHNVRRIDPATGAPKNEPLWIDTFVMRPGSLKLKRLIDPVYGRCIRRIHGGIKDGFAKLLAAYFAMPAILLFKWIAISYGAAFHRKTLLHDFGVPFYSVRMTDDIFPLGTIRFEGFEFPAPHNTDSYLRRIYGDYTTVPEENRRINHKILPDE